MTDNSLKQKRIVVPTKDAESWKALLADPDKHWRSGYSAMSTAYSWEDANGLPKEVEQLFRTAENPVLRDAELALAIPEYKVALTGGSRPSQNDVFAILTCSAGIISMMVEGKAREQFDDQLGDWKKRTSPNGAEARLTEIMSCIGITDPIPDSIRYQLLHRAASAVIEAKRFHANFAVLLIQSFVDNDSENHYDEFEKFLGLFKKTALKNTLIEISNPSGLHLYAAWVQSKAT